MPKITFLPEEMDKTWNDTSITYRDIAKASTLFPVAASLNKQYGFDKWGVDEVGKFLLESRNARASKGEAKPKGKRVHGKRTGNRSFDERLDALMSPFDPETITPNDAQNFSNLAEIEMQMDNVTSLLHDESISSEVNKVKSLNETLAKLSQEYRQIQAALGIDRSSRETQVDTGAEIKRMEKGALDMLREHGIKIACPHCSKEEVNINQGFIMFHFKADTPWSWNSTCPKCKRPIHLEGGVNGEEDDRTEVLETEAPSIARGIAVESDGEPDGAEIMAGG